MPRPTREQEKTRRLTREQKKALTRRQLLQAAEEVFLRRGFHRAGLEEVAEEAGFTRGAVYSNFEGKDDLFLALLDERIERRMRQLDEATAGLETLEDLARRDARRWMMQVGQEPEWRLLLMEFWTHAARDPRLRRELAARHAHQVEAAAKVLEEAAAELSETLVLPACHIARAVIAMGRGVTLEWLVDPDGVPEELLETMLVLFFREAIAPVEVLSEDASGRSVQRTEQLHEQRGGRKRKPSREE